MFDFHFHIDFKVYLVILGFMLVFTNTWFQSQNNFKLKGVKFILVLLAE